MVPLTQHTKAPAKPTVLLPSLATPLQPACQSFSGASICNHHFSSLYLAHYCQTSQVTIMQMLAVQKLKKEPSQNPTPRISLLNVRFYDTTAQHMGIWFLQILCFSHQWADSIYSIQMIFLIRVFFYLAVKRGLIISFPNPTPLAMQSGKPERRAVIS